MEDWSRVYEENVHEVFRFLMFYVGNRQEAEDIVQETFLKAFVSWEKFDRRSSARTWVITIARNLAVDRLRKQQRMQMLKKLFRQESTAEREWPEEMLAHGETRRELYEAIGTLKPDYRAVVVLRFTCPQSYGPAAALTRMRLSESVSISTQLLTASVQLEFKSPDGMVLANGRDVLANARVSNDPSGISQVQIEFKDPQLFEQITQQYLGQQVSIWLDQQLILNPTIQAVIQDGKASIPSEDPIKLAQLLNAGALPYPLQEVQK